MGKLEELQQIRPEGGGNTIEPLEVISKNCTF